MKQAIPRVYFNSEQRPGHHKLDDPYLWHRAEESQNQFYLLQFHSRLACCLFVLKRPNHLEVIVSLKKPKQRTLLIFFYLSTVQLKPLTFGTRFRSKRWVLVMPRCALLQSMHTLLTNTCTCALMQCEHLFQ